MIYWFTGQPGSGKTTLAGMMPIQYDYWGADMIDGDWLRQRFPTGYSEAERRANVEKAQIIARWEHDNHPRTFNIYVAVVAPYRDQREAFKAQGDVVEVYCHTDVIRGREKYFVADYEPPLENFIDLDTGKLTIEECLNEIRHVHRKVPTLACGT